MVTLRLQQTRPSSIPTKMSGAGIHLVATVTACQGDGNQTAIDGVYLEETEMRAHARWAVFAIATAVLGVGTTVLWLVPRNLALTQSELTLGSLAPPSQPTHEVLSCTMDLL